MRRPLGTDRRASNCYEPIPVPKHQRVAGLIYVELELAVRKAKCKKCTVYQPLDYKLADDTILQPDVLITCRPVEKKFVDFPPVLVIEVFSTSTVLRDKNIKFDKYHQQGIPYYLMVDSDKQSFELYELQDTEYMLAKHNYDEPVTFILDDGCMVDVTLNEIWGDA